MTQPSLFDALKTAEHKPVLPVIVAGTGHRPGKIGGHQNERRNYELIKPKIINYLIKLHEARPVGTGDLIVITGLAQGWDTWLAQAALEAPVPIRLWGAIPFIGQERTWPSTAQERYYNILAECEDTVVCQGYQDRNEWMTNNCTILLACWNGEKSGGTYNCIQYAERRQKKEQPYLTIRNVWPVVTLALGIEPF